MRKVILITFILHTVFAFYALSREIYMSTLPRGEMMLFARASRLTFTLYEPVRQFAKQRDNTRRWKVK